MLNAIPGLDFTEFMLVTLLKQQLRNTRAVCHHAHGLVGTRAVPAPHNMRACRTHERGYQSTPRGELPRGVILSDFSPNGCAPISPAWHHRSESQQRLRSGSSIPPCREQAPPREGTNNHRTRGKQPGISRAGSGHS